MSACWNGFCIAGDCDGEHHIDPTGYSWSELDGQVYCPVCLGYLPPHEHEDQAAEVDG
jgi:hypothetical protein